VRNIASEKWIAVRSGRQHRRSPRGTRSPFQMAPRTPLSSQSNWQAFLPARRRPGISLSNIRLPAAKSVTITTVEPTMSKSCARWCRRLTRRPWMRCLRSLPMRMISRICGTNSRRRSRLAADPRQSVVFSPSTRVADGDRRLRHQALLVEIRHRALNQRVPLQRDMIFHIVAYTLAPSHSHTHTYPSSRANAVPLPVSTCCLWFSPRQN